MNILITGASGQLGQALIAASKSSIHNFLLTDIIPNELEHVCKLDITNIDSVREFISINSIDVIVNCAAYTNVEKAEIERDLAKLINKDAVRNLAIVAHEHDITLIHMSTDYVYDGTQSVPYVETDLKNPINMYAITKYAGEMAIKEVGCKCILFRTAWMFSKYGNNFMKTIIKLISERSSINVVYDQVGTPTCATDLAKIIIKIIEENRLNMVGEYNYTNEGSVSWYDFAIAISRIQGSSCEILPCSSKEYGSNTIRPSFSVLDKSKIKKVFDIKIPHWFDSLSACIRE